MNTPIGMQMTPLSFQPSIRPTCVGLRGCACVQRYRWPRSRRPAQIVWEFSEEAVCMPARGLDESSVGSGSNPAACTRWLRALRHSSALLYLVGSHPLHVLQLLVIAEQSGSSTSMRTYTQTHHACRWFCSLPARAPIDYFCRGRAPCSRPR